MGYRTDLTGKQWQVIENLLDDKECKRKHSFNVINSKTKKAISYSTYGFFSYYRH